MSWTAVWIMWLGFLIVADIIADRMKPGATFSEHIRRWFSSTEGRIVLAMFFIALFFHLTFDLGVVPVIATGVGVVILIVKGMKECHS